MITELLLGTILQIISSLGYGGIFLLMMAESTLLPVPSEAVLPFAGYLIAQGQMDLLLTIIIATIGTIAGSILSYYIGKLFGKKVIQTWGKYFFVTEKELNTAHNWFMQHGEKTIFICRFIPVIRHVISLPAGAAEMKRRKFIIYTLLGGGAWNTILIIAGIQLQKNWNTILQYAQILDLLVVLAIILGVGFFIKKHAQSKNNKKRK